MKIVSEFIKYNKFLIVGVVAGLISGIFFSVYNDLRPQFENTFILLGATLFTTAVWYLIIMIITFVVYYLFKR